MDRRPGHGNLQRKDTRSHTLPSVSTNKQRASIESPMDLIKMIEPPPGFAPTIQEKNPFSVDENLIANPEEEIQQLASKIDFFKEENQRLQSKILQEKTGFTLEELLSSLPFQNTKQDNSISILQEQNNQLMLSYYELYNEFKMHLDFTQQSEGSKLREEIRRLRVSHAEELAKTVSDLEKVKQDLQERHISELFAYKNTIKLYETTLRNLCSQLKDRAPDLASQIHVPFCDGCLKKQEIIDKFHLQGPQDHSIKLLETSLYPASKHLSALNAIANDIEKSAHTFDPVFKKKMKELKTILAQIVEEKPQQLSSARNTRSQIHKQVVAIETALESLQLPTKEMLDIKKQFLELPFLLKPLFELTKSYELEVPVFVTTAISGADEVYKVLCKVAQRTNGVLQVQDVEKVLLEHERMRVELRETKTQLSKYEKNRSQ